MENVNKLILGEAAAAKIAQVSLSDSTIQRRISDMAGDARHQVVDEIKKSEFGLFAFQLDESTDVGLSSCSQLLAFVRYVHDGNIKEEFLMCEALETTTKASDVID
jgi:hypothetical protein